MTNSSLAYGSRELKEKVVEFFRQERKGSDYYGLFGYLESSGLVPSEKKIPIVGSMLSGLSQKNRFGKSVLEKIPVSRDVYLGLYGREPIGEPKKGMLNIYVLAEFTQAIEEIKGMQSRFETRKEIEAGLTPSLKSRIIDYRLFDLLQDLIVEGEFLDVVLLEKIRKHESDVRKIEAEVQRDIERIKGEACQAIEDVSVSTIRRIGELYNSLKEEVKLQKKKVEETRKKAADAGV